MDEIQVTIPRATVQKLIADALMANQDRYREGSSVLASVAQQSLRHLMPQIESIMASMMRAVIEDPATATAMRDAVREAMVAGARDAAHQVAKSKGRKTAEAASLFAKAEAPEH